MNTMKPEQEVYVYYVSGNRKKRAMSGWFVTDDIDQAVKDGQEGWRIFRAVLEEVEIVEEEVEVTTKKTVRKVKS